MRRAERAAVARPVPRTRPASSSNVGGDDDEAACSSFFVIMRRLRTREERAEAEVSGRKAWHCVQVEATMTTAMAATRRERLLLLLLEELPPMSFEDEVEGAIAFVSELRVVAQV